MNENRIREIKEKYEHLIWRTDMEAELLRVIGELVEAVEAQQGIIQTIESSFWEEKLRG